MITKYESSSNIYYLHNAWSDSPDGLDNFALEESDTAAYIGSYVDSVATENKTGRLRLVTGRGRIY